ncbi:MAG: hypothetical protein JW741_14940 [Sedimentisphaerales bacterium]|nr:hypothetical protein [Sedimentisphaerales bacterium]
MLRALLAKRALVKAGLGRLYRDVEGGKWHLQSDAMIAAVVAFNAAYRAMRECPESPSETVYKWTERRLVFRFCAHGEGDRTLVAKGFLLRNPRDRVKSYRYGLEEAANLLMAAQRGISVPTLYGLGIQYGTFRLPTANFLLFECLSEYELVGDLLRKAQGNPTECRAILMRTVPTFVSLYQAGCNHIDIHTKTIMMHRDVERPPKILDFHYARFSDRASLEVLAFEAGFFSGACSEVLHHDMIEEWASLLGERIGLRDVNAQRAFSERVRFYQTNSMSRKEKMSVGGRR